MVNMGGLCEEGHQSGGGGWRVERVGEDRGKWKSIVVKAGQKLGTIEPSPLEKKEIEEEE